MNQILKETTEWDCSYTVPNHTYLVDGKGKILAYCKEGTDEIVKVNGRIILDKRYRSFTKIRHSKLEALFSDVPKSKDSRIFKVLSNDKEYYVELSRGKYTCTCTGFTYRGKCKHITAVAEKVK